MGTMTPAQSWQRVFATLARELANLNSIADDEGQDEGVRDLARKDALEVRGLMARSTTIREDPLFNGRPK